jgi:hypothetical protein
MTLGIGDVAITNDLPDALSGNYYVTKNGAWLLFSTKPAEVYANFKPTVLIGGSAFRSPRICRICGEEGKWYFDDYNYLCYRCRYGPRGGKGHPHEGGYVE